MPARTPSDEVPLLLLNSLGTTTEIWTPLMATLSAKRPLILVDYAGHGRSPARRCPESLAELGGDLLATLDAVGVGAVHVAGVSIGGLAAIELAAAESGRVRTATVIGSTPVVDRARWHQRRVEVETWGTAGISQFVKGRWFTAAFCDQQPRLVASYLDMLVATTDVGYAASCTVLATAELSNRYRDVRCPVLVVSGGRDVAATVDDGRLIASGVGVGRHEVIEGAAHMIQAMYPTELAALVTAHIDTHS